MRVLICGTTGCEKKELVKKIIDSAISGQDYSADRIRAFYLEEKFPSIKAFLDNFNESYRRVEWDRAMRAVLQDVERFDPGGGTGEHRTNRCCFLLFHNTFYRDKQIFSTTRWDLIAQFRPTVVVTVIDDIYDIWARVCHREEAFPTRSKFDLSDVLTWRSAEIYSTELLAHNLYVSPEALAINTKNLSRKLQSLFGQPLPHYVVAVKHPVRTFNRLLFHPEILKVYASFPITKTRAAPETRATVDKFRHMMHEDYCVFDPLTIDELRFDPAGGAIKLTPRWPLNWPTGMTSTIPERCEDVQFSPEALAGIPEYIHSQIGSRDYRLVAQSDCVCAFRPYFKGKHISGGVDKEITYAMSSTKDVFVVHPEEDHQGAAGPLDTFPKAVIFGNTEAEGLDSLLQHLRKYQAKKNRN